MLTLGILASSVVAEAGAYDLLETTILGSSQSSVTFSNLISTYGSDYTHLQIRGAQRGDRNDDRNANTLQINGATSYSNHNINGTGSSVTALATTGSVLRIMSTPEAQEASGIFGAFVCDILDAFDTSKNTTVRSFAGQVSTKTDVILFSGGYFDTSAVDSLTLNPTAGSNFVTGSRFSLYGIKAA